MAQRRRGDVDDPLCAYSALLRRWRRTVGHEPKIGGQKVKYRLKAGHKFALLPVFAHGDGVAFDTGDMRAIAKSMAAACGEDPARFGGKSFRVGGATDLRCALGAAEGMAAMADCQ